MNPCVVQKYKVPLNSDLYNVLNGTAHSCVNDPCGSYRLGEILHDFFRYVGAKKLYSSPGNVVCDELLEKTLGVRNFSVDQVANLILPKLKKYPCVSLSGCAIETLIREIEQDAIDILIRKQNNL